MSMPSDTQVICSMVRVGRSHPPNKQVQREDADWLMYYDSALQGKKKAGKEDSHETKSSSI